LRNQYKIEKFQFLKIIQGGLRGLAVGAALFAAGCMNPSEHRQKADRTAEAILAEKHQEALGRDGTIDIERPSTILRRRLLDEQGLVVSGPASFGSDTLEAVEHWPDGEYPGPGHDSQDAFVQVTTDKPLRLTLVEALQVGARNSFEYQTQKENVFREALALDLERNEFRTIFQGQARSLISSNTTGDRAQSGTVQSGTLSASRQFYNGAEVSGGLAVDLANLLTGNGASSLGLAGDATVSIPLMRGSGRHIVTEPLTQAERNVVYAMWDFEQYKKTFSVRVASDYLAVLRRLDEVTNSRENYRSVIASARRSRRLADAGRLKEIDVDQASQSELRARQGWIAAMESYQNSLNTFKSLVGLPPDARVELDPNELTTLVAPTAGLREHFLAEAQAKSQRPALSADAPIELDAPTGEDAGPWELDIDVASQAALDHRLDFRKLREQVQDAQRKAVVAADRLGAELTLGGTAGFGSRRSSVGSAASDDAEFRLDKGVLSGLLTLNLPIERTAERIAYRNSLITLERAVRAVQTQEDQIKLSVSNTLSTMRQARENLYIQTKAVIIAEKRVKSVSLFLEAGRAAMRDLLEAQDALLTAQNGLTSAAVGYRVAELELQRNIGLLTVDERGLWQESLPEELTYE
jgi:outer membrane protein TolC